MAGGETSVLHPPHRGQPLCTMYQGFYFKGFPAAFRSHFPRSVRTKPTSCQAQVGSWTCPSLRVANQVGRGSHVPWGGPGVAGWDLKPQCPSGKPVTARRGFLQPHTECSHSTARNKNHADSQAAICSPGWAKALLPKQDQPSRAVGFIPTTQTHKIQPHSNSMRGLKTGPGGELVAVPPVVADNREAFEGGGRGRRLHARGHTRAL